MQKIVLTISLIIVDQSIKYWAQNLPSLQGGFFGPTICNYNLSWSIPINGALFFVLWIILVSAIFLYLKKNNWNIFLLVVLAGAISNMLDRILHGCVIDYMKFGSFPVFNLADVLIVGGMVLFLIKELRGANRE